MTLSSPKPQGKPGKPSPDTRSGSRTSSRPKQVMSSSQNPPVQNIQPLPPISANLIPANLSNPSYSNQIPSQQPLKLPKQLPVRLERLLLTKQITRVVALTLISSVLYLHGSTLVMNSEWNDKRQKLEKLQRKHREIIAATENLNHRLSLSIEAGLQDKYSNYSREKPDKVIFLPASANDDIGVQKSQPSDSSSGTRANAIVQRKPSINSLLVSKQPLAY